VLGDADDGGVGDGAMDSSALGVAVLGVALGTTGVGTGGSAQTQLGSAGTAACSRGCHGWTGAVLRTGDAGDPGAACRAPTTPPGVATEPLRAGPASIPVPGCGCATRPASPPATAR
jgi:hypothetical protein